jgi:phosphoserine phosphatase
MKSNQSLLIAPPDPQTPTVASDLEGTLTSGVTVRAMHRYLVEHGRAAEARRFYRSRIPGYVLRRGLGLNLRQFKNDWMRDLLRMFGGFALPDFRGMCEWVVAQALWPSRRKAVVSELHNHLEAGRRVIIVTGMFEPLLEALLARLPGMEAIGTPLAVENGVFTGELAGDLNVGARKRDQLSHFAPPDGKIYGAYGDTFSDSYMLALSEHPVAVFPDRRLRRAALSNGWRILEG